MKFREFTLKSGKKLLLGKNAENNDALMKEFEGKPNIILHTVSPGSPFGVITGEKPTKTDIVSSAVIVAKYSQDWRDNKSDVKLNVFTGKDVLKGKNYKTGTWNVKKFSTIKVKKEKIIEFEKSLK